MTLVVNPELQLSVSFSLPDPEEGRVRRLAFDDRMSRAVIAAVLGGAAVHRRLDGDTRERLRRHGILVPRSQAREPLRFASRLDDDLPPLYPAAAPRQPAGRLVVSPGVHLARGGAPPDRLRGRTRGIDELAARPGLFLVDPATGLVTPLWPSPALARTVRDLLAGRARSDRLDERRRAVLSAAGVLVAPGAERRRRAAWRQVLAREGERFRAERHAVLPGVVPPVHLAALRAYCRELHRRGLMEPDERQVKGRTFLYQDPAIRYLHHQLTPIVRRLVAEPVRPSFAFLSRYRPGAVLRRHTDRPQAEWNVSLAIDAAPELDAARAWPLHLEIAGRATPIRLGLGDAVLYQGTRTPHWRGAQPRGHTSFVCSFHFCGPGFAEPLD